MDLFLNSNNDNNNNNNNNNLFIYSALFNMLSEKEKS